MSNLEQHILKIYKKNGRIKISRFASGMYNVTMNTGDRYHIEDAYQAECGNRGEWVIRTGHVLETNIDPTNDNYVGHADSLTEAQFLITQL